jgi:hypothetical protein
VGRRRGDRGVAALIAIIADGVLYLLVLGTPQPGMFFDWMMGLATLAAVVYPFSTAAPLDQKAATTAATGTAGGSGRAANRQVPGTGSPRPFLGSFFA